MQYHSFVVEDFVQDVTFRNYCLKTNDADIYFWEQWITNNPSKQEVIEQAKQLVLLLSGGHKEFELVADRVRFKSLLSVHLNEKVSTTAQAAPVRNLRKYGLRAAAVVATLGLVTAIIFLLFSKKEDASYKILASSSAGEKKKLILPDGTKVTLNSGSHVAIAEHFNESTRELELTGEAFFEVVHNKDKPFIIHTPDMNIRVLGITFNVKAYADDNVSETSLIEGSVEVSMSNSTEKIILKPNEKIVMPNKAVTKPLNRVEKRTKPYLIKNLTYDKTDSSFAEISWIESRLAFTDQSFEALAKTLERWYNVSIKFDAETLKTFRFTATFEDKSITQVLDALQLSRQFSYTINNNQIIIDK